MGQAYDSSTGLYYFNARWYDSSIGRFISADPLPGNPFQSGSTNRYAYALDNPITYEDVSGLKSVRAASAQQGSVPEDWLQKDMAALGFFLLGLGIAVVAFGLAVLIAGWGVTAELAAIFIILGALLAILGMIILAFTLPKYDSRGDKRFTKHRYECAMGCYGSISSSWRNTRYSCGSLPRTGNICLRIPSSPPSRNLGAGKYTINISNIDCSVKKFHVIPPYILRGDDIR